MLKPDDPRYESDRYFVYRASTGQLEPNPAASAGDQDRARVTIELLRLDGGGRPAGRRRAARDYADYAERPYRFVYPS